MLNIVLLEKGTVQRGSMWIKTFSGLFSSLFSFCSIIVQTFSFGLFQSSRPSGDSKFCSIMQFVLGKRGSNCKLNFQVGVH